MSGLEERIGLLTGLISATPSFIYGIAAYVLMALGLYTMAERRGIRHAWLAWIPVADSWIIGSLSDQYRYVTRGQIRSKRKSLLVLSIIEAVLVIVMLIFVATIVFGVISSMVHGFSEDDMMERVMMPLMEVAGLCLPLAGVTIALVVIRYMALYDIYTSCDPGNNVLFLVLSILISVTEPFFVFFNRNKDLGMPPRREEPAAQQPWQPTAPIDEPWANNGPDYL